MSALELPQAWPRPSSPRPIVVIGAGGIVDHAHLPAYARLGLTLAGLYDLNQERARAIAEKHGVRRVFATLVEAAAAPGVVFDVAVPARAVPGVLEALPVESAVLIQKPLGESLSEAKLIRQIVRERRLKAAVNFQLRFSPGLLALKAALAAGALGQVVDLEVRVVTYTPWQLWPFLQGIPRLEVVYHSVHYLDAIRLLLGEPRGVLARVTRHPALPDYADVSSASLLDYGPSCRASVTTFHAHPPLPAHAMSQLKLEGTGGSAVLKLGVNLSYPVGEPDSLELFRQGQAGFEPVALRGSWFTEAFEGPICNLQRFLSGEDAALVSSVEDAYKTMALVEACYLSSAAPATRIPE